MHPSAHLNAARFFQTYGPAFSSAQVMELGSRNINGGLRELVPPDFKYCGVDFDPGEGVDIVLKDPYKLPFADSSVDIVISSSCFEHSAAFWLVFLEILRVLKPDGLFYLNAPSNGRFHRHPVDCWRFYPDSGAALVEWGLRSGYDPLLLESMISDRLDAEWNDFVGVFLKDGAHRSRFPQRMLPTHWGYTNGRTDTDPPGFFHRPSLGIDPELRKRRKRSLWKRLRRMLKGRKRRD